MSRIPLNRERINITLPAGMAAELRAIAAAEGRDRSALLEELAKAYIRKHSKQPKPRPGRR